MFLIVGRNPGGQGCQSGGGTPIIVTGSQLEYRSGFFGGFYGGRFKKRALSPCLVTWLKNHYGGYDWSKARITNERPWWGRPASTGKNTIHAGKKYRSIDNDKSLLFHELAHLPQWHSGALTHGNYVDSWVNNGFKDRNTRFEKDADEARDFLLKVYNEQGKPCG